MILMRRSRPRHRRWLRPVLQRVHVGVPTRSPDFAARKDGISITFRIQPHVRLHEWVAEECGFFANEGLNYVFEAGGFAAGCCPAAVR